MMKAVVCSKYGSPNVLKMVDYAKPITKDNEVLIKIYATSVTNSDIFIRSSNLPIHFRIPMRIMIGFTKPRKKIIGEVFSGVIEQIGKNIKRFNIGDPVYGLTGFSLGAYAEYKCMKEIDSKQGCIALKPQNISHEEATGIAYGGLLALQWLEEIKIEPNLRVLIYGASGTTGVIALQYLKQLGADVTCVCSSRHVEFIRSFGIKEVLDYTAEDSIPMLKQYDVVFDAVGKARTSKLKEQCKLSIVKDGKNISIDDAALLLDSNRLNRISKLVEDKKIVPVTDRVFLLKDIVKAHEYVELGHKKGNVAIKVTS